MTGYGPSPVGRTRNPCTREPSGFVNHHDSKSRPTGAAGPSASSSGESEPVARIRAGCSPWWTRYQTSPSGRTAAAVIEPGSVSSRSTRPVSRWNRCRRWRPSTSWSRSSEPPSGHQSTASTGPSEVERQVDELAGARVPDRRPLLAGALVGDREPGVARNRGEAARAELLALVPQLADDLTARGVDDPKPRMEHVAVLGHAQRDERLVRRQGARLAGADEVRSREPDGLAVLVDLASGRVAIGDPDREPARAAEARDGPPPTDREPLGPALGHALEERLRPDGLVERGDDPCAGLGAGRVVEPDDARAVGGRATVEDAHRIERHLAPDACPAIPGVELVAAALGRADDHPLGVVGGPGGEREDGRAEPSLPRGDGRHGLGRCHRITVPARRHVPACRRSDDASVSGYARVAGACQVRGAPSTSAALRPPKPNDVERTRS